MGCTRAVAVVHAAVSTWLNGGIPPAKWAEWAGHSVEVLLKIYAKCLDGGAELLRQRVQAALGHGPTGPGNLAAYLPRTAADGGRERVTAGHPAWPTRHETPGERAFVLVDGCSPDRIRTGATALRGRRPRPLDDGAVLGCARAYLATWRVAHRISPRAQKDAPGAEAGVPGLEPRLTEPESVGLPITPYPIGARRRRIGTVPDADQDRKTGSATPAWRPGWPGHRCPRSAPRRCRR